MTDITDWQRRINEAANRLDSSELEDIENAMPADISDTGCDHLEDLAGRIGALITDLEAAEAVLDEVAAEIRDTERNEE
jgi:hypothetical protein